MWKLLIGLFLVCSTSLTAELKVLAFSGSLRQDSVNTKLVTEAAYLAEKQGADVTVVNLRDYPIPFYDADLETQEGMPIKARELRRLMIESDIVMIASPEYNGSVTAVLKNFLDWASRKEEGGPSREAFKEKTFILMSGSPGSGGGARGLVHLRDIISNIGGSVATTQVVVPYAYEPLDEEKQKELEQLIKPLIVP